MNLEKWRQIADRLGRMDRDERRDRVRQEVAKRQDGLLARLGFDFARSVGKSDGVRAGNFFFKPDGVNPLLALLRQRRPEQVECLLQQSEKILQHRFDLLGYQDLAYGTPIDWHLDLVHGKRAPRKVFHRVLYLDFHEVGDSKVTWELNRHQHLVTLAKAYRLTGDDRYADEILRQWRHWWAENPYAIGINWASSLEAAFRSLAWLWTYHLLQGAPGLPNFREEWLRGLALHGRHIERYLSTYFSPNTHLLGEGVALFFLGVLCPELNAAERWKSLGWRIVLEGARRQVQADGFHFEQSTYYHVYALDFFLHSAVLASVNDIPIPKELEEALGKMLTALYLLGRAGPPPRLGDDDGGRLFDPRRHGSDHMLDPLAAGAILFNRGDYKAAAVQLREETIWLLGPEGVHRWDQLETTPIDMNSAALQQSGLYLLTSERPATQLVVDAGPQGTQSGGHGHADALSVTLQSQQHSLLIDPGTYEYAGEGAERDRFRGTVMHNTLRIDGADQAEPGTAFSWRRLTHSKAEQWIQGKHFDLLVASHDGYQRLVQPVTHRRWVFSLKNGVYLVRDLVEGQGRHQLDLAWHLGQEMQLVEENVFRVKGASQGLALLPVQGSGWAEEVRKESWSPTYGQKAPMTVVNFSTNTDVPAEVAVLLVTLEEAHRKPGTFARIDVQESLSSVRAYRYTSEAGEYTFCFGERGKPWRQGAVSSDAEFCCWSRMYGSAAQRLIMVNGSYAEVEGGPELRCSRPVSWGEVTLEENQKQIFSSEPEAVEEEPGILAP
jgi:hypothetical protein